MVKIHQTVENIYIQHQSSIKVFECKDKFSDTIEFCNHYGFEVEDSCNAILLKSKKPEIFYAMFCVLGSNKLDVNHKAKIVMGSKKVSFASKDEAEEITNQIYGGISPLGLENNIKVFIDQNVMAREKVFIGAGNRVSKFFLTPKLLQELTNATIAELT